MKLLYLRFIDDIFLIWTGALEELTKFNEHLDTYDPAIKFDFFFQSTLTFLIPLLAKQHPEKLEKTLYRKIDRQAYLHQKSEHQTHHAFAKALQIRKICTSQGDFNKDCMIVKKANRKKEATKKKKSAKT